MRAGSLPLPAGLSPGLTAITGGERSGKTSFLRRLSGDQTGPQGDAPHPDAQWLDLRLPTHDDETPKQVWDALRSRSPQWNAALHEDLELIRK